MHLRGDAGLLAEIRELSGTDGRIFGNEDLVRMILPPLRADYRAAETYRMAPGTRVRAPISILIGDADPRVSVSDARAWSGRTDGGSRSRVFRGGHFYLDKRRPEVAAAIRDSAAEFRSATTGPGRLVPASTDIALT